MHELIVTQNILEIVLRHATKADADKVSDVYLVIGSLSSVVDDSVQFYWDIVSEGTAAEGAQLHFQRIQAKFTCKECSYTYTPAEDLTCPSCKSSQIRILSGQEFYLESIGIAQVLPETSTLNAGEVKS